MVRLAGSIPVRFTEAPLLAAALWSVLVLVSPAAGEPPARILDMSPWKLTLPMDTDRPGNPDEVRQPELQSFEDPPPVKQHVVCAQFHGGEDDLLMIRLEGRKLLIERESHEDVLLDSDYNLGAPFELKLQADEGRVQVWHDGDLKLTWSVSHAGCYFKAGCYTQSNPARGDARDSYGEVVIYRLSLKH